MLGQCARDQPSRRFLDTTRNTRAAARCTAEQIQIRAQALDHCFEAKAAAPLVNGGASAWTSCKRVGRPSAHARFCQAERQRCVSCTICSPVVRGESEPRIDPRWCFRATSRSAGRDFSNEGLPGPRRRYAPGWGPTTVGDQCWRRMVSARCAPTVAMWCSVVRISRLSSASTARRGLRTRWLSVSCSRCGAARGRWSCASTCAGRWSASRAASRHGPGQRERARSCAADADGNPVRFPRARSRRVCSLPPPPSGPSRSSSARPDGGAVGGRLVSGLCAEPRIAR